VQSLSLGANPIKEYEELDSLSSLTQLKQLDLAGCPISAKGDYKEKLYSLLKSLEV